MQLRAPLVMTMTGTLLRDHAICVEGQRISKILPITEAPADDEVIDLPETMVLPGFLNAHCHLDLSHLRGRISYDGSFADWIQKVLQRRETLQEEDVAQASHELLRSGVTTVYDHVGAFSELAYIIDTPLRKRLFLEVIGVAEDMGRDMRARQEERAVIARRDGIEAVASPHATYSLNADIFRTLVNPPSPQPSPRGEGVISIHCAESAEEWEMFTDGRGKLRDFMASRGPVPLGTFESPLQYLAQKNLLPSQPWLAVHCNTLTDNDIARLKQSRATVVHCPRSHRYFNHPPFPLEKLRAAGIPVAIGTDSLASCPNFDFLEELRVMRAAFPILTTEEVLGMACQTLAHEGFADIIGLPMQDDILQGPVTFSMIGGRRVV